MYGHEQHGAGTGRPSRATSVRRGASSSAVIECCSNPLRTRARTSGRSRAGEGRSTRPAPSSRRRRGGGRPRAAAPPPPPYRIVRRTRVQPRCQLPARSLARSSMVYLPALVDGPRAHAELEPAVHLDRHGARARHDAARPVADDAAHQRQAAARHRVLDRVAQAGDGARPRGERLRRHARPPGVDAHQAPARPGPAPSRPRRRRGTRPPSAPCAATVTEPPCVQSPSPSLYSVNATGTPPSPGWPVNVRVTGRLLQLPLAPLTLAHGMPSATKPAARRVRGRHGGEPVARSPRRPRCRPRARRRPCSPRPA